MDGGSLMPLHVLTRTSKRSDKARVPDDLKVGTLILAGLRENGVLGRIPAMLPLSRRGGYGTQALFAFAAVFLLAGRKWGIDPFFNAFVGPLRRIIGPVAGVKLPSSSSVSRALGGLDHPAVRSCVDQLLTADPGILPILGSPHVQHRDAHGRSWHVLDLDPTVEAFRQRGLPDDPSLPVAKRISPGKPGYTGHKRGELRIRHIPVQHAGSGLWLGYRLDATGGSIHALIAEAIGVARDAVRAGDTANPTAPIVVRADGEFGSVGAMRTCLGAKVQILTRLSRYSLFDREEVVAAMAGAVWRDVVSSGGGPARQAADLGIFTFHPDEDAAGADGGPVTVRVVVARFVRTSPPDHGVVRDGFQLELFATSLSTDAWPAADVVALYFGRGAMENRFAQEDREFGIDRTFSYHPPGQEWVSGIAMFLWNVLIARGVELHPLPTMVSTQTERPVEVAQLVAAPPIAAGPQRSAESSVVPQPELLAVTSEPPRVDVGELAAAPIVCVAHKEVELRRELWSISSAAFADISLSPGWRLDDDRMEMRCANDRRLLVSAAESDVRVGPGPVRLRHRLIFRTELGACDGCPLRTECTPSNRPNTAKMVTRTITADQRMRAGDLLKALRMLRRKEKVQRAIARRLAAAVKRLPVTIAVPAAAELPRPLRTPVPSVPPGALLPVPALFLPAMSRTCARELLQRLVVEYYATPGGAPLGRAAHPLVAQDGAARQHRRLSWQQRAQRWKIGEAATLVVSGKGAAALAKRLNSANSRG